MNALIQRIRDLLRERRIRQIGREIENALPGDGVRLFYLMRYEIKSRSAEQIARMERSKGLTPAGER